MGSEVGSGDQLGSNGDDKVMELESVEVEQRQTHREGRYFEATMFKEQSNQDETSCRYPIARIKA